MELAPEAVSPSLDRHGAHTRGSLPPSTDMELTPEALSPTKLPPDALSPSTDTKLPPGALSPSLSLPDQELDHPTLELPLCGLCLLVICVGDLFCGFLCVTVLGQTWRLILSLCKTVSLPLPDLTTMYLCYWLLYLVSSLFVCR